MTNGKYAYILFDVSLNNVHDKMVYPFKWFISHYTPTLDTTPEIKKAFESVFIMAVRAPKKSYGVFLNEVKRRIKDAPWFGKEYTGRIPGTPYWKNNSMVCPFSPFCLLQNPANLGGLLGS